MIHSGIWIDASTLMMHSLDFFFDIVKSESTQSFMYYLDGFTTDDHYKYYESWFIATVPYGRMISLWFNEFDYASKLGHQNYCRGKICYCYFLITVFIISSLLTRFDRA